MTSSLEGGVRKINEIVVQNIKRIIKQKCLKQSEIAKKAGYTPNQFSAMMNNRKVVKDTDILNILEVLDVEANELFMKQKN